MTTDLFPDDATRSESPRLRWIKAHNLEVRPTNHEPRYPFDPRMAYEFEAFVGIYDCRGFGDTQDDAIADWARRNGVRLWNEV